MTYGYDTRLDIQDNEHHGKKSISSLARSMLEEICTMRSDEAVCVPRLGNREDSNVSIRVKSGLLYS